MKKFGIVMLCLLVPGLLVVAGLVGRGCRMAGNALDQGERLVSKTIDADNVIYNYEWFKERVEALDAAERRIKITQGSIADFTASVPQDRTTWGFEDKQESSRLRTDLRGQQAHLENLSAEFRARSKMANRAIFKGNNSIVSWVDRLAGVESTPN